MKKHLVIALAGLAVGVQASPVVFYGGDEINVGGGRCQVHGPGGVDSRLYDNFTLASATNVDGVFGTFFDLTEGQASAVAWEIRSGVSAGNGGTLLYSGSNAATATINNEGDYVYSADISTITLGPGNYFLSVAVDGGNDFVYITGTDGHNGVGGPLNDGNSYWNCPQFSFNWIPAETMFNGVPFNLSIGMRGTEVVPEPASFAVLGLGAIALVRRRRK